MKTSWVTSGEKIQMNKREHQARRDQAFRLNDEMYRAAGFGPPTDITILRQCQARLDAANAALDAYTGTSVTKMDILAAEWNAARLALKRAQQ